MLRCSRCVSICLSCSCLRAEATPQRPLTSSCTMQYDVQCAFRQPLSAAYVLLNMRIGLTLSMSDYKADRASRALSLSSTVPKPTTSLTRVLFYPALPSTPVSEQQALKEAQEDLAATQKILDEAMAKLAVVEEGIAALETKYRDCLAKRDELDNKCSLCEARLVRADKVSLGAHPARKGSCPCASTRARA